MSHSPPPWRIVFDGVGKPRMVEPVLNWNSIRQSARDPLANARLIAASPLLYQLVERLAQQGDSEAAALIAALIAPMP